MKLAPLLLILAAAWVAFPSLALARGFRGPSSGQMQAYQRQMQAYEKQMQKEYEMAMKQEAAEQQAFLNKFDTNRDGQITGKEKGPAEKFLRDRRLGKAAPLTASGGGAGSGGGGSLDPIGAFGAAAKEGKEAKKKNK